MLFGRQTPNIMCVPDCADSSGDEAVRLAEYAGLRLDPWQQLVLREGLGEQRNGKWAALEVATVVSRQNGKGAIIEARELAGLFLFDEQLIIHTSHLVNTTLEAFNRIVGWIEGNEDFNRKVLKISRGKGSESIEIGCTNPQLHGRQCKVHRIKFLSRTGLSGRGFSCDCLILDESMILDKEPMAALVPTLSARKNPQIWYFGSAGIGEKSTQLASIRKRALEGGDDSLAYFEWSVDVHGDQCLSGCTVHYGVVDRNGWLASNPGIGYRLTVDYIARELRALGKDMFARERLGVGDYPDDEVGNSPISVDDWIKLTNADSKPGEDIVFAVDIPLDRGSATIVSYSVNDGGFGHVEIVDRRIGTDWVAGRLVELKETYNPIAIAMDARGPAASLVMELQVAELAPPDDPEQPDRGDLFLLSSLDMAGACGQLVDAVRQGSLRHLGDETLTAAVSGACTRPIVDAWVWTRRKSMNDVSPLVAATIARYAYQAWHEMVLDYDILSSAW